MRLFNILLLASRALRRNKMRSLLTGLGIIIGVGAVIAMVSIGNGARAQVEETVAQLGRDLVVVFPGSFRSSGVRSGWGTSGSLTLEDALALESEVPGVAAVSPMVRDRVQVNCDGTNWNTMVLGVSPDYLQIRSWPLASGAMFTETDLATQAKVALVGQTVIEQMGLPEDPRGRIIRIKRAPFKIIGVLTRRGFASEGRDEDDTVIVPYTSYLSRVDRSDRLNYILVKAGGPSFLENVQKQATLLLRQRHAIPDGEAEDFIVRTQDELTQTAAATVDTMTALLGAIAGVSLLVGGIGIMNIMLVSVTERTREIGVRLAVGAHGRDVLLQFLTESVVLSLGGGLLGAVVGIGSSHFLGQLNGWPVLVSPKSIAAAAIFSTVVGVFFGFYPAQRAARLDPIDALRHE